MEHSRANTFILASILLILILAVLKILSFIFIPLTIAIFLAFIFSPIILKMVKAGIPRMIGIFSIILIVFITLTLVGLFMYSSALNLSRSFPKYQKKFESIVKDLSREELLGKDMFQQYFKWKEGPLEEISPLIPESERKSKSESEIVPKNQNKQESIQFDPDWPGLLEQWWQPLSSVLLIMSGGFMDFLANISIIMIILIFLLLEVPDLNTKLERAVLSNTRVRVRAVFTEISQQIGRYMRIKFLICLVSGVFTWLCLLFLGVDFAIIWGVLGFVLMYIPYFGSLFVLIGASIMSVIQFAPENWISPLLVFSLLSIIQFVIGSIVEPKLQGRRLDLSPFLILIMLLFWGWLWGSIGMILAIPLTSALQIICHSVPQLRPVAIVMGTINRPVHHFFSKLIPYIRKKRKARKNK